MTPVQVDDRVEDGVPVAIHYDAGIYDGHYGFMGYANTTFEAGSGTVVVTLSSHPGVELRVTPLAA